MASSYDKVYRLLAKTTEAMAIRERITKAYENTRIIGWTFDMHDAGQPTLITKFKTSFHPELTIRHVNAEQHGVYGFDCIMHVSNGELREIVHAHFKHDVATFFTDKKAVLEGRQNVRGRVDTESFPQWFKDQLRDEFASKKEETERAILASINDIVRNEDYTIERRETFLAMARTDIRKCLQKYSNLGEDFMRSALLEYAAAEVLEG